VAHGGNRFGIGVYLKGGQLRFEQVNDWKRHGVASSELPAGEHAFEAIRHADGRMTLRVDDGMQIEAVGEVLSREPGDSLQIGADTIQPVGDYPVPNGFVGTIRDLEISYGD
jgi:hypothetical protein